MKTYTYKDNIYNNLYDLSEAMGQDGTFIPLSISDADLGCLGVAIGEAEEPIENIRTRKIFELKRQRDSKEVEPVEYGGHLYDYDSKARDRIAAAILAVDVQGEGVSISWTTADSDDVVGTVQHPPAIVAALAVRSNLLHIAYRTSKAQASAAQSKAEIDTIYLD